MILIIIKFKIKLEHNELCQTKDIIVKIELQKMSKSKLLIKIALTNVHLYRDKLHIKEKLRRENGNYIKWLWRQVLNF